MSTTFCTYQNVRERGPYVIKRHLDDEGVTFTLTHHLTGNTFAIERHRNRRLFASIGLRRFQAVLNMRAAT